MISVVVVGDKRAKEDTMYKVHRVFDWQVKGVEMFAQTRVRSFGPYHDNSLDIAFQETCRGAEWYSGQHGGLSSQKYEVEIHVKTVRLFKLAAPHAHTAVM